MNTSSSDPFAQKPLPHQIDWYANHIVFRQLEAIYDFYDALSTTSLKCINSNISTKLISAPSIIFTSLRNSIKSILSLLNLGHFNDAFALVRKYSDAIVIDTYKAIIIKNNKYNESQNALFEKLKDWFDSSGQLMQEHPKKEFHLIKSTFPQIVKILKLDPSEKDSLNKRIRDFCNDNLHYNSFDNFSLNDATLATFNKQYATSFLNVMSRCMTFISSLHFAFLYELTTEYFLDDDYIDYLDCGLTPPQGAERWVEPALNDFFSKILYPNYPELGKYLISLNFMDLKIGNE